MVKAGRQLKIFYQNLTHVTCTAHLLHNACMRIKSSYPDVDNLIASVKAATRKNRSRREMFRAKNIPIPPAPVVTRWGSWLSAAFYYGKNFPTVRSIFEPLSGGTLVENAKEALENPQVFRSLTKICSQYGQLENIFEEHVDIHFSVEKAHKLFTELNFGEDSCRVKPYLMKRLDKSGITEIMENTKPGLTPHQHASLRKSQSTSITVERSFSMVKKINARDRNFRSGNIEDYLLCKYNAHVL